MPFLFGKEVAFIPKDTRVEEAFEKIEQGVKDVYSSDNFVNYLKMLSKFHNYSFNNVIRILAPYDVKVKRMEESIDDKGNTVQEENDLKCTTIVDGYSDFAFFNKVYTVYNQCTLNKAIRRIRKDYNLDQLEKLENGKIEEKDIVLIPSFSCHVLRHTAATRLCESRVNTRFIMDMLGHADICTTMNIYVDVTKDFKKSELEKFESYTKMNA